MPIDLQMIVETADRVADTLTGDAVQVRQLVRDHDVVIGIWPDPKEEGGVGTYIVKGQRALMECATSGKGVGLSWTAVPCTCAEQAVALQEGCGEAKLS